MEQALNEGNESVRRLFHDRAIRVGRLAERGPVTKLSLRTQPNAKDSRQNSKDDSQQTEAIQKQLRDREQEVEMMSGQLDALKRIDQDARARRSIRIPSALAP